MRQLLQYILSEITGNDNYTIEEREENGMLIFNIETEPENMGLIIGKNGKTIMSIQELVRVRGKIENTSVFVKVSEKFS